MTRLRSLLFAPGNRAEILAKLPRSEPDGAVVDLEDAVPASAKDEARSVATAAVPDLAASGVGVFVRVNGLHTDHFDGDVAALEPVAELLAGVVVPKLESPADVVAVHSALAAWDLGDRIVAGIETVAGVDAVRSVLAAEGVVAAYFGAEDFVVDLGGVRTSSNVEVLYARSRVSIAGRLAGVAVIDQIVADFGDGDRFTREATEARALGFSGKLCIHPAQVALANELFQPSVAEIERARALLAAYDAAVAEGSASMAFDGQMVDEPVARQARMLLEQVDG